MRTQKIYQLVLVLVLLTGGIVGVSATGVLPASTAHNMTDSDSDTGLVTPNLAIAVHDVEQQATVEHIYISQTAQGVNNGTSCANAHPVTWFNDVVNWSTVAIADGKIGPGDTVHLCGTISTALVVQGSGAEDNPITILFESGAKLSKEHWNHGSTNNSDAAIYGDGVSYLVFDGGTNGVIECTNNGTNLAYQLASSGIEMYNSSHMLIQNLTIQNIFVRVEGPGEGHGNGIAFRGSSHDITIRNNRLSNAYSGIFISFRNGDRDVFIYDNSISNAGLGIVIGSAGAGTTITNVALFNNTLSKGHGEWSGNPDIHTNDIQVYAVHTNSRVDGLKVYNNILTGDWGNNSTAYLFLEGEVFAPLIYNNLIIAGALGEGGGNGYIYLKYSPGGALVANNTFIGNGSGIGLSVSGGGATIKNNLFYDVAAPIMCPYDTTGIATCDKNIYWGGTIFTFGNYAQMTYEQWRNATGFDTQSTQNQPDLDTNYVPTASDKVARDQGVSMSTYFTDDKNGVSRPQGDGWDIGAYEFEPKLVLRGQPDNQAIHLNWTVNITVPVTTTWHIDYYTQTSSIFTATNPFSLTRSLTLEEYVQNYQWYTVTLYAMPGKWLSDTVHVMPTDRFVYLPLVLK